MTLKWHLVEGLVLFDLLAVLGDAEKISTVIPEKSSFTEVFEGLKGWERIIYIVFVVWLVEVGTKGCILNGSIGVDA